MKILFLAFQFLTIIPVPVKGEVTERDIGGTLAFFPLVGAVQGLVLFAFVEMLLLFLPSGLTAACALLLLTVISGGLHIDGLSDTFDALAVTRGTEEKRLSVMKDSRSGPIGVTAIILVMLIKFSALEVLLESESAALFLMPLIGKWGMVSAILSGKPARADGLGRIFFQKKELKDVLTALVSAVVAVTIIMSWHGVLLLGLIFLFSFLLTRFFMKHFGGLTGDCLGALCELSEMVFLAVAAGS